MGGVDLDHLEAGRQGAAGRGDELLADADHLLGAQGARGRPAVGERDGAGCDRLPGRLARTLGLRRHRPLALERTMGGGLAPGVGDLDAGNRALRLQQGRDAGQGGLLFVIPQPDVAMADAAGRLNAGRLDEDQGCPAEGEAAEVDEVPVLHHAIDGRVLAHRRDGDAVLEGHAPQGKRGKQDGLGHRRQTLLLFGQGGVARSGFQAPLAARFPAGRVTRSLRPTAARRGRSHRTARPVVRAADRGSVTTAP